jgi:hypothetical protein
LPTDETTYIEAAKMYDRTPTEAIQSVLCNGCHVAEATSINWRASLVPAAAVIPAPRVYVNIAAVKTLVVHC